MKRLSLWLPLAAAIAVLGVGVALAQQPVLTYPVPAGVVTNLSGKIATTNKFQSIAVANPPGTTSTAGVRNNQHGRQGCLIQNLTEGTNKMWVFFGPIASALTPSSIQLSAGQSVSCTNSSGGIITDQISIAGTAPDFFSAFVQ